MISHGRNYLPTWWWYSAFPGLAIYFTVLGFNLVGDGLRDLLDPKSRDSGVARGPTASRGSETPNVVGQPNNRRVVSDRGEPIP